MCHNACSLWRKTHLHRVCEALPRSGLVLLGGSSGGQSKSTSSLGQKAESHMLLGKHGLGAWPHLFWLSFLSPVLERLPWNTVRSSPPSSS